MTTTSTRKRPSGWAAVALTALLAAALSACGGGGGDGAPAAPPPAAVSTTPVALTVIDTRGRFVAGAAVSSGANSATTDATGRATLAVPTGSEQVVAVTKAGFAEQFKVLTLAAGTATPTALQAMLIGREAAQTIAAVETGGTATGSHGVTVTFPANALVDAAGLPVTGTIEMLMTPVNVADIDVGAFPGLFEGVPTGAARTAILSFGSSELVPQQGGRKLKLAAGKTAQIELPLYINRLQDGSDIVVGSTVPLWSLDTATGLWMQEGSGTAVASAASPTGLAVRATISHFSWWNLDRVAQTATVNLTVVPSGPSAPAGTPVAISASITAGSGPTSTATGNAVVGTARTFGVAAARSVTRFTATVQTATQSCTGSVDVSPPVDTTVAANINLVCINLSVRLVRPAGASSTNSQSPLDFMIEVDGNVPDSVELLVDGAPVATFTPQFFYRGFWDSASFAEGPHTLRARATLAAVVKTSSPVTVVIDRTAPLMTGFTPNATAVVDRTTTFTVNFSEAVLAAPFALADAIRLTVTPAAGGAPVVIPSTATLDTGSTTLTVVANAALPIGVASLSWGGLRDAATNNITGTVSVSWSVSRVAQIGPDLLYKGGLDNRVIAINSAGVLHVVQEGLDSNAQALRFDGTNFVPFGPPINERTFGSQLGLAIDRNGLIYVVLEQLAASGGNAEILVRRYDAAANVWQTIGPSFPTGRALANSSRPRLAIDATNRPVISFFNGANGVLEAFRFDAAAWASLGGAPGINGLNQHLALNSAGNPVVAYLRSPFPSVSQLDVAEHNGVAWVTLGTLEVSGNSVPLGPPQIALAADGRPWVAWHRLGQPNVTLARYDGTTFVTVPITPALTTVNGRSALTFLNGDPVVAGIVSLSAGRVDLHRFRGGAWEPAVSIRAQVDLLNLLPDGNSLVVSHVNGTGNGRVSRVVFP